MLDRRSLHANKLRVSLGSFVTYTGFWACVLSAKLAFDYFFIIVPLEALGNTARWLGIPRVGHEAGMCPLGPKQPQPSQEAGASSPLSLSTYRCTCTSRKVAADDARV